MTTEEILDWLTGIAGDSSIDLLIDNVELARAALALIQPAEPAVIPEGYLSPHFSLAEMTYSETASREGIDNTPDEAALINLEILANTLEQVRVILGSNTITITSGYRSPATNAAVGGSSSSAHMSGLAADFICPGFGSPLDVCLRLESEVVVLGVDQLISEYNPGGWVHLGLSTGTPRCQCLTINNSGTTTGFA